MKPSAENVHKWQTALSDCLVRVINCSHSGKKLSVSVQILSVNGKGAKHLLLFDDVIFWLGWEEIYQEMWLSDYDCRTPFSGSMMEFGSTLKVSPSPWIAKLSRQGAFGPIKSSAEHYIIASPEIVLEIISAKRPKISEILGDASSSTL